MTATGSDPALEIIADEMLADDRRRSGDKSQESRRYILSEDQLEFRREREISYERVENAISGLYVRAYNPLARTRPKSRAHMVSDDNVAFDARLPGNNPTPLGWNTDHWARSRWWADYGFHHLDRYQRCRIRRMYRQVGPGKAREVLKDVLSEKYGVPPWVITRVAINSRTCNT